MKLKTEVIDKDSENAAGSLRTLLADEHVLSTRTREAYVKVNGSNFSELRMLFEHQSESLDAIVADISKRVLAIGQIALTTFWESLAITRLNSHNERFAKQDQIIEALLEDHRSMILAVSGQCQGAADEKVENDTVDFMAGLLRQHLEIAGALREWLE